MEREINSKIHSRKIRLERASEGSMISKRYFGKLHTVQGSRLSVIKDIVSKTIVGSTKALPPLVAKQSKTSHIQSHILENKPFSRQKRPDWVSLNITCNEHFKQPTIQDKNKLSRFFNSAEVKYEWSVANFAKIPSEIVRIQQASVSSQIEPNNNKTKLYPGKTKIPFQLINGLPEILFLGRSNAGKSSILNNLVTELSRSQPVEAARTSQRAGFTKTLNCFNIGNKFRLIDSPGYGYCSTTVQGAVTMDYLQKRRELRRCYVLISANHGFTKLDMDIIEYLTSLGKPFEIIFTKMDKVRDLEEFQDILRTSRIQQFPTLPRLIFTNSVSAGARCPKRYGIDYLRYSIFESCGLI